MLPAAIPVLQGTLAAHDAMMSKVFTQVVNKPQAACQLPLLPFMPILNFLQDGKVLDSVVGVQAPPLTKLITSLSEVKAV